MGVKPDFHMIVNLFSVAFVAEKFTIGQGPRSVISIEGAKEQWETSEEIWPRPLLLL